MWLVSFSFGACDVSLEKVRSTNVGQWPVTPLNLGPNDAE